MKKGTLYKIEEKNILKECIFLGSFYALKGMLNFHTKEFEEIEWSKFPLYFFLSKDFGLLSFNSLKQFKVINEIKEEKGLSIKEINSLIIKNREKKENTNYNNIFIKSIIKISETKEAFK